MLVTDTLAVSDGLCIVFEKPQFSTTLRNKIMVLEIVYVNSLHILLKYFLFIFYKSSFEVSSQFPHFLYDRQNVCH